MPPDVAVEIIYTQRAPLCGWKRYCKMHDFTEKPASSFTIPPFLQREYSVIVVQTLDCMRFI